MLNYTGLIEQLIKISIYICLGYVGAKTGVIDKAGNKCLSRVVLYLCVPFLLLAPAMTSNVLLNNGEIGIAMLSAFLWQLVMIGLGILESKLLLRGKEEWKVYAVLIAFGNIGIFGFPVVYPLFGDTGLQYASLANSVFNLLVFTFAQQMIAGKQLRLAEMLKGLWNPSSIAAVLVPVLFVLRLSYPKLLTETVSTLGNLTLPLLMFTVGCTLATQKLKAIFTFPQIYAVLAARLLLMPAILLLPVRWLVPGEVLQNSLILLSIRNAIGRTGCLSLYCSWKSCGRGK